MNFILRCLKRIRGKSNDMMIMMKRKTRDNMNKNTQEALKNVALTDLCL